MAKVAKDDISVMTPEMEARIIEFAKMPDDEIDTSDIPEVTDWSGFQRGRYYKPVKKSITLRLDADLIAWFKAHAEQKGGKYQTDINTALRQHVEKTIVAHTK